MTLKFSKKLRKKFLNLDVLTDRVVDLEVKRESPKIRDFKKKVIEETKNKYELDELKDVPIFRTYRDFFWEIGIDPTKNRPAAEALTRRVLQGKPLPEINTLVDAYNLASLKSGIPMAAFDLESLEGDLRMRFAREGEEFLGIGMDEPVKLDGVEIVISDSEKLVAIYPYRDSEETKITQKTTDVLLMVCGVPGVEEKLKSAENILIDYVTRFCNGVEEKKDCELEGIKAVIFDLDETLIDAHKGLKNSHEAVAEKLCEYLPCKEGGLKKKSILKNLKEVDDQMNFERKYDRDSWWPKFIVKLGFDTELDRAQIEELTRVYWKNYAEAAVPYPDAGPILRYLQEKGYQLGLITDFDGPKISKRDRIYPLDIADFFEAIVVGGEDTPKPKPDPKPFELVASKLEVEPGECVMVGDKPFTDIDGANSVGMKTILVKKREWEGREDPDFVVESLDELKELL